MIHVKARVVHRARTCTNSNRRKKRMAGIRINDGSGL